MAIELTVNGSKRSFDGDTEMPLLWFLREDLGLVGTKFGCGIASCGACTVHLNGAAAPSCRLMMGQLEGAEIRTIEGLAGDGPLHALQQAWIEEDVSQCGYCQAGQIMTAVALLERHPQPSEEDIDRSMRNLCRCGSYPRIRKAILRAAGGGADAA